MHPETLRTLVLVDGEHHPPVVRAAIEELRAGGRQIVGAALLGGAEKLPSGELPAIGVPELVTGPTAIDAVLAAIERLHPDELFDLSGEPVLDARTRLLVAAHALGRGIAYRGADFAFDPPPRPRLATKPTIAVIGTGKRSGKTAISAHLARHLARSGRVPVLVAMGRGGPGEPEVIDPAVSDLTPGGLLTLADQGRHAASDHFEDALAAGVVTIGTRRAGGGLAGAPAESTFAAGVALANERPEALMVLEGSGATIPPAHADATLCVVPSHADPELVAGYLGPYALLLSDLVVITLQEEALPVRGQPSRSPPAPGVLEDRILDIVGGTQVLRTVLRPWPLVSISQRSTFFATTASEPAAARAAAHLEKRHHATVVGWTNQLADRDGLAAELESAPDDVEVLVTELKAAAVDVATRVALDRGWEVVYCDNRPEPADGRPEELAAALDQVVDRATERFAAAHATP